MTAGIAIQLTATSREGLERAFLDVLQRRHPGAAVRVEWQEPKERVEGTEAPTRPEDAPEGGVTT